jgi:hypothetical protein
MIIDKLSIDDYTLDIYLFNCGGSTCKVVEGEEDVSAGEDGL